MEPCYSWTKPLQNTGLRRARYVGLKGPPWLWMSTLTLWVGYKRRWVYTAFSWHWGEHSKPKCSSLQLKACIREEPSHCCVLPLHHISSRSGAVTLEALVCALLEECGGMLKSLAYVSEFKEYLQLLPRWTKTWSNWIRRILVTICVKLGNKFPAVQVLLQASWIHFISVIYHHL